MAKAAGTDRKQNERAVVFEVEFDGKPEQPIPVRAYVFDRRGALLTSAPMDGDKVVIKLPEEQLRRARLLFGPEPPPPPKGFEPQPPDLDDMKRWQAYEPVWNYDPKIERYELLPFPEILWKYWVWCGCRVRGRVVKPVTVGGTTYELPVCHARVHVCEVDRLPWVIWRLPDDLIYRLRDDLIRWLEEPVRWPPPLPDPPPFKYDPGVIDPSPIALARMNKSVQSGAGLPQPQMAAMRSQMAAMTAAPESQALRARKSLSQTQMLALSSSSVSLVRDTLLDNLDLVRILWCNLSYLWYYYTCEEIAVLETDSNGRFDTTFFYLCAGDQPDLYFWVEYNIGGVWTTVFAPGIACATHWDYACGSEVTLTVTDPRVVPCGDPEDLPGMQVAVLSIGNGVSMSEIQGIAAGAARGLTTAGQPFGGVLEPHVEFSRTNLFAAGITHYRWSYQRLTASDGVTPVSSAWHALDRRVIRHYMLINPITFDLSFPPYELGPDPAFGSQNLFKIQPLNPPAGTWASIPIDAREDSASGFFLTHLLQSGDAFKAAGKYALKLELFRSDGSLVDLTAAGVQFKVPNVPAPFGAGTVTTVAAPEENLIRDAITNHVMAFKVVLHVDNNPCEAEIYPISGAGLTADQNCGFYRYTLGATATLSFKAYHPFNFATFGFSTYRGTSIYVPSAGASGNVGDAMANGYVRGLGSIFSKTLPVVTLLTENTPLGQPPCSKAAFATNLSVDAMATDGWGRLDYLDDDGTPVAFALEPGP
jgi:hypothetical protein